jgi:hypothetical protein
MSLSKVRVRVVVATVADPFAVRLENATAVSLTLGVTVTVAVPDLASS